MGLEINERVWCIECNGTGVLHLFDANESETFDVTQAVVAHLNNGATVLDDAWHDITENDVFTFTLIMDGANG